MDERRSEADEAMETTAATDDAAAWIKWNGGECPVAGDVLVNVRFHPMNGEKAPANETDYSCEASQFWWDHRIEHGEPSVGNIIAYRVVPA